MTRATTRKGRERHPLAPRKQPGGKRGRKERLPKELRERLKQVLETATEELPALIARVAKKNPARAVALMLDASEYVTPRLARQELVGDKGGPFNVIVQRITRSTAPTKPEETS